VGRATADAELTGAFAADWRRGWRVLAAKVRRAGGVRWAAAQLATAWGLGGGAWPAVSAGWGTVGDRLRARRRCLAAASTAGRVLRPPSSIAPR